MFKYTCVLLLLTFPVFSQQMYTPLRAAFGAEVFGTSPKGQFFAEAAFGYCQRSFWDIQAGMGLIAGKDYLTFSFSSSVTYAYLLNPYRRISCQPEPGSRFLEMYIEAGVASYFANPEFNRNSEKQSLMTPLGLAGMRFHFVTEKWIYIVKARYTPAMLDNRYASVAGVSVGLGWK